ncbi:TlpA family protein disulfide reductase [Mucilaginibacter sp. SMC90]|uniref:TlpA family protein disulfide reductase n=1 Tax=Mucilaginibacter sp. SMC90 TaxID=2929803 RepID=UPI001FB33DAC|nr:TlpA disulfide reductase family protein [Mucilaginibacter sp. SMC90]UOE52316.1 TlpA family protein disulfide reductase [Mucilaginibacter sp. SMC90]
MKKIILFLLSFYFINKVAAQNATQPLIIQGKLSNSAEKMLKIFFEDAKGKSVIDTIRLNDSGEFYLKTFKITKPQRTSIQQNTTQINRIYVAPGYDLHIIGDASDYVTLSKTKKITGIGAESNQYRVKLDSILVARNDKTAWYELKTDELILFLKKSKALDDSLLNAVFSKPAKQDKYVNTFKKMIDLDNQSLNFYMMLQHLEMSKYNAAQITELVAKSTPSAFSKGISHDEYLVSDDYKSWVLPLYYTYEQRLDLLRDSASVKQPGYELEKIKQLFTGKVRDYYLNRYVEKRIGSANSFEQLNFAQKEMQAFIGVISNATLKKNLADGFMEKKKQLMQVQIGKPAPAFTLTDDHGKVFSLTDFKGKVVYIDLWASWCGPCRQEMPSFKKLSDKFKANQQIAFISIAVHDGEKEWRNALKEEKPDWLQLYDKDGTVAQSYIAYAIPKYILIDKEGKMLSFDAPGPGNAQAEQLIKEAIAK